MRRPSMVIACRAWDGCLRFLLDMSDPRAVARLERLDKEKIKTNKFRYKDFLVLISQTW